MTSRLSVRARLLVAVGLISLVALVLADIVVYGQLRSNLYSQVDKSLEAAHPGIESTAKSAVSSGDGVSTPSAVPSPTGESSRPLPAGAAGAPTSGFCTVARESAPGMFVEVLTRADRVVTGTDGTESCPAFEPGNQSYTPAIPASVSGFHVNARSRDEQVAFFSTPSTVAKGPTFRVRAERLPGGELLVLATPVNEVTTALAHTLLVEFLVTIAALAAAIVLGIWLVRIGLRPLRDIERTAEVIAGGDLVHRVPNPNPRTEVGHLATAFNVMVERVEALVTNLRASENRLLRFVGDASHELRTPIAAVSAYSQLFERGDTLSHDDLRRIMSGIRRESSRMARLVEDLLVLAKLDEQRPLQKVPVEIVGLVGEAIETAVLVGPEWPVQLAATEPVEVIGDHGALRQVIDNLLANVRAHTPAGTETLVTVRHLDRSCTIEVADDGPGITEAQAALVFERFFRADPSRSRLRGGAGLGLAIVASIVAQHGGTVEAVARAESGALFRIVLPALESGWPQDAPEEEEADAEADEARLEPGGPTGEVRATKDG